MEDDRIWEFEKGLWVGDEQEYRAKIDGSSLFVVPAPPYVLGGHQAMDAMAKTPRWEIAEFSEQKVERPQEGLIVIAYRVKAKRSEGNDYEAHCTSTLHRLGHDDWRVVQHQQTPPLTLGAQGAE